MTQKIVMTSIGIMMGLALFSVAADTTGIEPAITQFQPAWDCPVTDQPPTIDGTLDDPVWRQTKALRPFVTWHKPPHPADQKTDVRICRDKKNLYIAVRAFEENMDKMVAKLTARNAAVWNEDSIELFIDTNHDHTTFYQFVVSAIGTQFDNLPMERGVNKWHVKTARETDAWTAEIVIPFLDIGLAAPKPGQTIGFNICRNELPHGEKSQWSYTPTGFHAPDGFGDLVLSPGTAHLSRVRQRDNGKSETLEIVLRDADIPQSVLLTAQVEGSEDLKSTQKVTLSTTEPVRVQLDLPKGLTEHVGSYRVKAMLSTEDGQLLWSASYPMTRTSDGPNSVLYPAERSNNVLYGNRGGVLHEIVLLANHSKTPILSGSLVVTAPSFIELTVNQRDFSNHDIQPVEPGKGARLRHTLTLTRKRMPSTTKKISELVEHTGPLIMLKIPDDAKEGRYPFSFHLATSIGNEPEHKTTLVILPPASSPRPKRFQITMDPWSCYADQKQYGQLAQFYAQVGFTSISHCDGWRAQVVQSLQLRPSVVLSPPLLHLAEACGDFLKKHPEWRAVGPDGKTSALVCPTVLAGNPKAVAELLGMRLDATQWDPSIRHLWVDQEGPGGRWLCFCDRCFTAFRTRFRIPRRQEISERIILSSYLGKWTDFTCEQTTKAHRHLRNALKKRYPHIELGAYSARPGDHARQVCRVEWRTFARAIDIAHPSFYSNTPVDITRSFDDGLRRFITLVKTQNPTIKTCPTLTMGWGRAGKGYVLDPRLSKLQMVAAAAAGTDGVLFWQWLPGDGRFYLAISEAAGIITRFEELLHEGRHLDKLSARAKDARIFLQVKQHKSGLLVLAYNLSSEVVTAKIDLSRMPIRKDWRGVDSSGLAAKKQGLHELEIDGLDVEWLFFGTSETLEALR